MEVLPNTTDLFPELNVSKLLPTLLLSLLLEKYTPTTRSNFDDEYDYIVVGAGSGGATVAARLSEMPCMKILLLEAGSSPPILTEVPVLARAFVGSGIDWKYQTVSQKHTASAHVDRKAPYNLGKAIGGTSTWNGMLFVRGNRMDYDEWAAGGATGWSYNDVLPYFLKLEDYKEEITPSNSEYHARGGPVTAEKPGYNPEVKQALFEAAKEMGYPSVDVNGASQYGFIDFEGFLRNGRRCSAGKSYLVPVENQTNIHIVDNAFVEKVLINDGVAEGVVVRHGLSTRTVRARREVILSAGAIHTPQILMLSGIGPADHLKELGIPTIVDLPVGKNFHDQAGSITGYTISRLKPGIIEKVGNPINIAQYTYNGTGPLSSTSFINTVAFLRTDNNSSRDLKPEYQLYFLEIPTIGGRVQTNLKPEEYGAYFTPYSASNTIACLSQVLEPKSRGTVTLDKSNPQGPPLIDPNYYSHPDDLRIVVAGMKKCYEIFSTQALKKIQGEPFRTSFLSCRKYMQNLDKFFECHAKSLLVGIYHPVGTAKMGSPDDPSTVVNSELKVKGIDGLRVVDASVIPKIPAGNTHIPIVMIAEKVSDIIKEGIRC